MRATRTAVGICALALTAGCAGGAGTSNGPARPVPTAVVPAALPGEGLTIQPNHTVEVTKAIASVGPQLLVSDARLWELHLGARLVGALQLASLKPRIDPARAADRNAIIGQIVGALPLRVDIDGLPVWTTPNDGADRAIYVWFGAHAFGVLQLKGDGIAAPQVADDLIARIATQPAWDALPPQAYLQT